jgi:hypothetical protein
MKTELRWGLILATALSLWTLLLHATGVYTTRLELAGTLDTAAVIIPVIAVACAMIERRRTYDKPFGYVDAFRTGMESMMLSWPFSAAFMLLYHKVINPAWLDRLVAYEVAQLRAQGAAPSVLLARETALRARAGVRAELTSSFIGTVVLAIVLSAVLALLLRRRSEQTPGVVHATRPEADRRTL